MKLISSVQLGAERTTYVQRYLSRAYMIILIVNIRCKKANSLDLAHVVCNFVSLNDYRSASFEHFKLLIQSECKYVACSCCLFSFLSSNKIIDNQTRRVKISVFNIFNLYKVQQATEHSVLCYYNSNIILFAS